MEQVSPGAKFTQSYEIPVRQGSRIFISIFHAISVGKEVLPLYGTITPGGLSGVS